MTNHDRTTMKVKTVLGEYQPKKESAENHPTQEATQQKGMMVNTLLGATKD